MFIWAELRKKFLLEGINSFYFMSLIFLPILHFAQWYFNFQIFPLETFAVFGVNNNDELLLFLFIGFFAVTVFNSLVQSAWRVGFERFQGTLSVILIAPIQKLKWLYARAFAISMTNCWIYIIFFIAFVMLKGTATTRNILLSVFFIFLSAINWSAFLLSVFLPIREGSYLFSLFNNTQNTFTGVKIPLANSPKVVQVIGALFPVSYTILLLRQFLQNEIVTMPIVIGCIIINIMIMLSTCILYKWGLSYLYRTGSFELY